MLFFVSIVNAAIAVLLAAGAVVTIHHSALEKGQGKSACDYNPLGNGKDELSGRDSFFIGPDKTGAGLAAKKLSKPDENRSLQLQRICAVRVSEGTNFAKHPNCKGLKFRTGRRRRGPARNIDQKIALRSPHAPEKAEPD
jgi:hypothetical protein